MAEPGQRVHHRAFAQAGPTLAVVLAVVVLMLSVSLHGPFQTPARAQVQLQAPVEQQLPANQPQAKPPIDGVPILLDGREVMTLRRGIAGFSLQERAETISRRLKRFAQDDSRSIDSLSFQQRADDDFWYLSAGQDVLLTINERDAQAGRLSAEALAEQSLQQIKVALRQYRQDRKPGQLLRHSLYALIASVGFLAFCFVVIRLSGRLFPLLARLIARRVPAIRLNQVEIISAKAIAQAWLQVLTLLRLLLLSLSFFYLAAFILRLYPWTRAVGEDILGYFYGSAELVLTAIGNYLPNLFIVAIILFLATSFLRTIRPFFAAVDRGSLVIPGFYAEWGKPTFNLLMALVIALAAVLAFPFLPGFSSPAFQGVSVFLGLLLSLGSTSAISNVIGGIILIYTRAFRIGDHIRVGDVIGDIIEKNFLAVRICTPANQIITIPNSSLLSNKVVNYNLSARDLSRALILQTTITLGYDLPWRQAHATLVAAALASEHILREPAPFVLQTNLGNDAISYQVNAYTDNPNLMVLIVSELHQNIQDQCAASGIEILSPTYASLRDGSASTIPAPAASAPAAAPEPG
jgi:small-conductance mechanosensitive channel